jgi:hypothetical protein
LPLFRIGHSSQCGPLLQRGHWGGHCCAECWPWTRPNCRNCANVRSNNWWHIWWSQIGRPEEGRDRHYARQWTRRTGNIREFIDISNVPSPNIDARNEIGSFEISTSRDH